MTTRQIQKRAMLGILALFAVIVAVAAITTPVVTEANVDVVDTTTFSEIYDSSSPSVVAISVIAGGQPNQGIPGIPGAPDGPNIPRAGSGSGFVIDTQGHIVTNAHVVQDATQIEVNLLDGTLAHAEIVGLDVDSDIAVIRVSDVPAERLQPVTFGNSDALRVGETVLAIGSPFGERWTLTSGIVSALDRTIQGLGQFSIGGVIQTDAAINPGNSGGPLLNLDGEVIGVNSQIVSDGRGSSGVGFAVPSNLVRRVAQDLIATGSVNYSFLGISGGNVTLNVIESLNIANNTQGVVVSEVTPGGPAERGGLQPLSATRSEAGQINIESVDIITAIDGMSIRNMDELIGFLARNTRPGDEVTLTVLRNGTQEVNLDVTLSARQ